MTLLTTQIPLSRQSRCLRVLIGTRKACMHDAPTNIPVQFSSAQFNFPVLGYLYFDAE